MRFSKTVSLLVISVLLATLLAACGGAAPTARAGSHESAGSNHGPMAMMKVSAADCAYGGEFESIEAVDADTVKFTLCAPDVAFPSKVAFSTFCHPFFGLPVEDHRTGECWTNRSAPAPTCWIRGRRA